MPLIPPTHTTKTPTVGLTIHGLKSIRLTLQECLENDTTGKGSGSRLALAIGTLTLCVGLVFVLAAQGFLGRDFGNTIQALILAIAGGGAGPYTVKRAIEVFKRMRAEAPSAPGSNSPAPEPQGSAGTADGGNTSGVACETETPGAER